MLLHLSFVFGRIGVVSMIWLYRFLFLPALVVASPYYLLRMKKRGGYGKGFAQRFGSCPSLPPKQPGRRRIWLQAVSVGEMLAIAPLLETLKKDPSVEVYLTTTTSTGYKLACERYAGVTLAIAYFPLDWWLFSVRAWKKIQPDLVVLTEGERWPEHVRQASGRSVPVFCINARLSDKSYRRLKAASWVVHTLLGPTTRILACSEHDAKRFRDLGCEPAKVVTTGNIKLDLTIPVLDEAAGRVLRGELGIGDEPVLLGSSTWPGEEAAMIGAYRKLRAAGVQCRLLLVPRHAERRAEVESELGKSGYTFHFRSRGAAAHPVDICVADTTGELRKLTQLASVVFVGKSLPPHDQGQTPVEAAALGKPVLFGPGMSNFHAISQELLEIGAARLVENADDIAAESRRVLEDPACGLAMSAAAAEWHRTNQGAVQRTLAIVLGAQDS